MWNGKPPQPQEVLCRVREFGGGGARSPRHRGFTRTFVRSTGRESYERETDNAQFLYPVGDESDARPRASVGEDKEADRFPFCQTTRRAIGGSRIKYPDLLNFSGAATAECTRGAGKTVRPSHGCAVESFRVKAPIGYPRPVSQNEEARMPRSISPWHDNLAALIKPAFTPGQPT